jgi:hypothetical protein
MEGMRLLFVFRGIFLEDLKDMKVLRLIMACILYSSFLGDYSGISPEGIKENQKDFSI